MSSKPCAVWPTPLSVFAAVLVFPAARTPRSKEAVDLRASYTKQEVMVPMRDGTKLFTIAYAPRDTSPRYPFMLTRTAGGLAATATTSASSHSLRRPASITGPKSSCRSSTST